MPGVNPLTGKPGPAPMPPRDGDKLQARQRINVEVRTGYRPRPDSLPCKDCGDIWEPGKPGHEYDHFLGYAAEHHYDVEAVCTKCQRRRSIERGEIKLENLKRAARIRSRNRKIVCSKGHRMSRHRDGKWRCRACRLDYWKSYNAKRRRR
jgi:hypothetical protein